jgi:CRISPR-associated protein Cas1
MATLILDRSGLEVRADGAALALYEAGERRGTVPVNLLERVVIQGNVRIETAALARLATAGVATALLSGRQSRRVAFVLGEAHSDAAVRIAQAQLVMDRASCDAWARRLVKAKLRAQTNALRMALAERPDSRKSLLDALSSLCTARAKLELAGQTDALSVRGIEGAAAAAYFAGLRSVFAESLGFTRRNRRPPRDPVNACLSLGYTLLHFEAVRACHRAGLDPLLGLYHRPAFGRESMACDLVEPLRPRIDEWVWRLFQTRVLRTESFVRDKGACLLAKAGRNHFYPAFEQFSAGPRRYLRRQCMTIVRSLRRRGEPLLEAAGDDEEMGEESL